MQRLYRFEGALRAAMGVALAKLVETLWYPWRAFKGLCRTLGLPWFRESQEYDANVRILSLADFAKTNLIRVSKAKSSDFDPEEVQDMRIISVVGLFNKGKTFFLNKLFGLNLKCGSLCETKGLSCIYLKQRRMRIIDSPGVQSTVSYKSDDIDTIVDAENTEAFLQELISQISHHIIFVVNDFTSREQKMMQKFEEKANSCCKASRQMVVVHNLRDAVGAKEAEELFTRQITSCYDGIKSHLSDLVYHSRPNRQVHPNVEERDSPKPVHHYAICKDGSKAGKKFNARNFKALMDHLEHTEKLGDKVGLTKLLADNMEGLLPRFFFVTEPDNDGCADVASGHILRYNSCQHGPVAGKPGRDGRMQQVGSFSTPCKLEVKKQGVISESGEILSHDQSFNPQVNIHDEKETRNGYIVRKIVIECPGVRREDVKWESDGGSVLVEVKKRRLVDEGSVQPVSALRQQFGDFKKRIPLPEGHSSWNGMSVILWTECSRLL